METELEFETFLSILAAGCLQILRNAKFYLPLLDKGMATHSTILAWRILWTEEPGRLQSMKLQRVGHDWSDLAQHTHV